ncbi:hypothetical protein AURDEDRAFT_174398 [Auricularia subglabra TFB-10046 SS5]|uniref:Fungal calcium binding protein domain-containing protein n=1 Tax=Auricularia subglabra (strain TFB-10046 / SS5) TaxID=717982 RepID=J0LGC6_AURST|nr:hypothetical protein AURDEDRAFT_174398 [Auricularia subglabra TFB-10046 SS5]
MRFNVAIVAVALAAFVAAEPAPKALKARQVPCLNECGITGVLGLTTCLASAAVSGGVCAARTCIYTLLTNCTTCLNDNGIVCP